MIKVFNTMEVLDQCFIRENGVKRGLQMLKGRDDSDRARDKRVCVEVSLK
jgi:hypothetical protein